mmetsp:Transcript_30468/g.81135  ORF Transcript_30468/g.81135 Transcript_30468/m.81135 type:complete len:243 (+) Transcript_30468:3687-4415(+)
MVSVRAIQPAFLRSRTVRLRQDSNPLRKSALDRNGASTFRTFFSTTTLRRSAMNTRPTVARCTLSAMRRSARRRRRRRADASFQAARARPVPACIRNLEAAPCIFSPRFVAATEVRQLSTTTIVLTLPIRTASFSPPRRSLRLVAASKCHSRRAVGASFPARCPVSTSAARRRPTAPSEATAHSATVSRRSLTPCLRNASSPTRLRRRRAETAAAHPRVARRHASRRRHRTAAFTTRRRPRK